MMKLNRADLGLGGGSLLQVAHRSPVQMMSYIIDTTDNKVIIIDGGYYCEEDADNLYKMIMQRGGCVDLWIITHAHHDHYGALNWLMENLQDFDIKIKKMCFHFPAKEWLAKMERYSFTENFFRNLDKYSINVVTPNVGDILECGGVSVEIVSIPVNYEDYSTVNPTSIIIILHFPKKDVLFLGDFDTDAQDEFLKNGDVDKIRKDIVQMAHHGQKGVDHAFYQLIRPKVCLYPTPKWLWENNYFDCEDPLTAGKGPYETLETRKWMDELGVEMSFSQAEGDWLFI